MNAPTHQNVRVALTAAQILDLGTTPVQIVPGSPGQLIVVYNMYLRLFAGTTPFNPSDTDVFGFYVGSLASANEASFGDDSGVSCVGFADQTTDQSLWFEAWLGNGNASYTANVIGSGLSLVRGNNNSFPTLWPSGGNWAEGNGTMLALVEYSYVTP